jgi:SAM-dependent methyltransferase
MDTCGCDGLESMFDGANAEGDRQRYRRSGPDKTTRMLLDLVRPMAGMGSTILDIGGGIGVIDHELLRSGAGHAVLVDASSAYLDVARQQAREAGLLDRIELRHGDFVGQADEVGEADVVTLDRVICCYGDPESLVGLSAARARRAYGLVLPRDRWLIRAGIRIMNIVFRLRRSAYRAYAHPNALIDGLVERAGLRLRAETGTFFWRVVVFERG